MDFVSKLLSKVKSSLTAEVADFKVSEITMVKFSGCPEIARQENFVLYKLRELFCLAMFGYEKSTKNYVLFSVKEEAAAFALYSALVSRLLPLVHVSKQIWNQQLLQKVCNVMRDHPSWSVVHVCAHSSFIEPLQLRHPEIISNANTVDDDGCTPLHIAINTGDRHVIQELMLLGASVDAADSTGQTVFHLAARTRAEIVKLLVLRPAPCINCLNAAGESAVHMAAQENKPDCLDVLLINGADAMNTKSYRFPIHCAVASNSIGCCEMLIRRCHEQLSARDKKHGGTPLHWCRKKEMVDLLLTLGADANAVSYTGETPLHIMIKYNRIECVRALLCREASADVPNYEGRTPLHLAIPVGDANLIRCLLVFGADMNSPDKHQVTPRHLAATCGGKNSDLILYVLHMVGAERCKPSTLGCSPGCAFDGSFDGRSDHLNASLLSEKSCSEVWDDLLCHELVSSNVSASSADNQGAPGQQPHGHRVLCLDGGGIRGLVLIAILMAIEKETRKPLKACFDWISGTSTGGILALAIAFGKTARYALGMYFRLKDEVFFGTKPYKAERLESVLKNEFGEHTLMMAVHHPRVMVTTLVADRHPPELHIFRNYDHPKNHLCTQKNATFKPLPRYNEVKVWEAARCSGAAPTFFRAAFSRFLDGGLASNNPTLDTLTEIHEFNSALRILKKESCVQPVACVVSLGTGKMPTTAVKDIDLFRPEGVFDAIKVFSGAQSLARLLVEQATSSEGQPVARSRGWCNMIGVPFFRFSPQLTQEVDLDETDDQKLLTMMWETMVYLNLHKEKLKKLAESLCINQTNKDVL